jgi:hypothetical protein
VLSAFNGGGDCKVSPMALEKKWICSKAALELLWPNLPGFLRAPSWAKPQVSTLMDSDRGYNANSRPCAGVLEEALVCHCASHNRCRQRCRACDRDLKTLALDDCPFDISASLRTSL